MGGDAFFDLTLGIRLDMLEVYGRGYVMDYCMASFRNQQKQEALTIYVTDALKTISENTAKLAGGNYVKRRFAEYLEPEEEPPKAQDIIRKVRNKFRGGE